MDEWLRQHEKMSMTTRSNGSQY